jgi:hypothetical protein
MRTTRRFLAALIALLTMLATASWAADWPVPLNVVDWGNVRHRGFPASGGVPFPQGMLTVADAPRLVARDADGALTESQLEVVNTWPDGSVKWLSTTLRCTQPAGDTGRYTLSLEEPIARHRPLARAVDDGILVDAGAFSATFDSNGARFYLDGAVVAGPLVSRISTRERAGNAGDVARSYTLPLANAALERNGPLQAVVKFEGWHENGDDRISPSTVRLTFTRGQPFVRISHTFVMSADPDSTVVTGVELIASLRDAPARLGYLDALVAKTAPLGESGASILQRNVAERKYPQTANEFLGAYTVAAGGQGVASGERYPGAASLVGGDVNVGVYVDQFWQMSPTSIRYASDARELALGLWPSEGAGELDLSRTERRRPLHYEQFAASDPLYQDAKYGPEYVPHDLEHSAMGVARTHDAILWFSADPAEVDPLKLYLLFRLPYTPFVSGDWNVATGVLGKQVAPRAYRPDLEDANLRILDELWNRVEQQGWYGWIEHGNLRYAYDKLRDSWMPYHPKYAWYNSGHLMEGGTLLESLWSQYLRTGSPLLYLLAQARGRSVMDVSTVHYHEDESLVGAMIRHGGYDPWAGPRATHGAHAPLAGIPLHHYVTGDLRAADAVRLIGDRNYRERDLSHGRNIDTDMNTMLEYWQFTGDGRYLSRALDYLDHYHTTLDAACKELTYVDYRTHALRALYEAVDDTVADTDARAKIADVFSATREAYAAAGRTENLEMAAFGYALDPTPTNGARLEDAVERWTRRVSGAIGWLDTMPLRGMNDIATTGAVNYALYWLQETRKGLAEPVRMFPDGGTFSRPVAVDLASPTRGGMVIYTTVENPTPAEWRLYDGPITLTRDTVVRAQVYGKGLKSPATTVRAFKFEDAPIQGAELRLWLRADAGLSVEDGRVTGWADQSGHGRHATTTTRTAPMAPDGAPRGDGSRHLRLTRLAALEGDCTVVFVAAFDGSASEESLGAVIGDGDDGWIGVTRDGRLSVRFSSADAGWRSETRHDPSERAVWTLRRLGDALTATRNGAPIGRATGASRTTLNAGVIMGMREDANRMSGALHEVMVFDSALDDDRLAELWRTMHGRHNIAETKE